MNLFKQLTIIIIAIATLTTTPVIGQDKPVCPDNFEWDGTFCIRPVDDTHPMKSKEAAEKAKLSADDPFDNALVKMVSVLVFAIAIFNIINMNFFLAVYSFFLAILYAYLSYVVNSIFGEIHLTLSQFMVLKVAILISPIALYGPWIIQAFIDQNQRFRQSPSNPQRQTGLSEQRMRELSGLSGNPGTDTSPEPVRPLGYYFNGTPSQLYQENAPTQPSSDNAQAIPVQPTAGKRKVILD